MTRKELKRSVQALAPWYIHMHLGKLVWTRPWTRATLGEWLHCERGFRKMDRFILPVLPVPLAGAGILEAGCNSGVNLVWALRHGADRCVGVESVMRYWLQASLVRKALGLEGRYSVFHADLEALCFRDRFHSHEFDMGWLLNVIYHIPKANRVRVLRDMAYACRYVILQGNGLGDESDGRGITSLTGYCRDAKLEIMTLCHEPHVRGLVVVAASGGKS